MQIKIISVTKRDENKAQKNLSKLSKKFYLLCLVMVNSALTKELIKGKVKKY